MSAVAGSIERISIKNRLFPVASDADANMDLGGHTNEVAMNGDSGGRLLKTRKGWMLDGIQVEIDHDREDQQFLEDRASEKGFFPIVVTLASDHSYQGNGQITGELKFSTANGTASLSLSGPGELTRQ